jgi:hypothetical protein
MVALAERPYLRHRNDRIWNVQFASVQRKYYATLCPGLPTGLERMRLLEYRLDPGLRKDQFNRPNDYGAVTSGCLS